MGFWNFFFSDISFWQKIDYLIVALLPVFAFIVEELTGTKKHFISQMGFVSLVIMVIWYVAIHAAIYWYEKIDKFLERVG